MQHTGCSRHIHARDEGASNHLFESYLQAAKHALRALPFGLALVCGSLGCQSSAEDPELTETDETTPDTNTETEAPATNGVEREVKFEAAGLTLEGTLQLPEEGDGQFPGVVLVHGSGPLSRDAPLPGQLNMSFGFSMPAFQQLSNALADAGYAVLRYDKRTCGPFNECAENDYPTPTTALTVYDFMADAEAALDYLQTVPEVDADRLFIIGHSQGATFVPGIVRDRSELRAGVMLAPSYRPVDELLAAHEAATRNLLAGADIPEEDVESALGYLPMAVQQLAQLRDGDFEEDQILQTPVTFWESWMTVSDEAPAIAGDLDRGLLVLGGNYDWNVPPEDRQSWADTLSAAPHQVETLDCVTHALNCISQPDFTQLTLEDIGETVHQPLVDKIVEFLAEQ